MLYFLYCTAVGLCAWWAVWIAIRFLLALPKCHASGTAKKTSLQNTHQLLKPSHHNLCYSNGKHFVGHRSIGLHESVTEFEGDFDPFKWLDGDHFESMSFEQIREL